MKISVIIPTLNESKYIARLIQHLRRHRTDGLLEIIVCDGGSSDNTLEAARKAGATTLRSPKRGRAPQMNYAATRARGNVLYFVHADVLPPASCFRDINRAVREDKVAGCFPYRFDSRNPLLKINAFVTRYNGLLSGGGDQTLFVRRSVFENLGGFREKYVVMEDFDFVRRLKKKHAFHVLDKEVLVSPRKYTANSYLHVQIANAIAFGMFLLHISPRRIAGAYHTLLN